MKLVPLNGHILVCDEPREEKSKGGIILAQSVESDIIYGKVLEVSDWITEKGDIVKPQVKPGDRVIYRFVSGGGQAWKDDGIFYRILKPIEILAKSVTE